MVLKKCCWEQNAAPEWVAMSLGLQVPRTATDRRAGPHTNEPYDVVLLAFTVPTAKADWLLQPLLRKGTRSAG
ncbi:hypothetical protein [Streptomyces vinaceus]|uniref:hypothetical protein n=1 Tax=Streptomyces vinaceus TaxID=1960 RepID=UPI0035E3502D